MCVNKSKGLFNRVLEFYINGSQVRGTKCRDDLFAVEEKQNIRQKEREELVTVLLVGH